MNILQQLLNSLLCWLPRPYFVNPDEAGVRITLGKHIKDLVPGWYVDIPLIHNFIKVNIALQGVRFAVQSVTTTDGIPLAVRGAVRYRINDARKAIFETDDFDKSLEAVAGGVIEQVISTKRYEELRDRASLRTEIAKALRLAASGWGLRIQSVYLPDFTEVKNIRVLGSETAVLPNDE